MVGTYGLLNTECIVCSDSVLVACRLTDSTTHPAQSQSKITMYLRYPAHQTESEAENTYLPTLHGFFYVDSHT